jgi:hypothetical protein
MYLQESLIVLFGCGFSHAQLGKPLLQLKSTPHQLVKSLNTEH